MKRIILVLIAFAFTVNSIAQKMDYQETWKKIEDLTNNKRLPQSALLEIEKVYNTALREKNYNQLIKAIFYRMNNQAMVQENTLAVLIDSLKRDAEIIPQPAKSLIYSIIGDMYKSYYRNNQWQIRQRTRASIDGDDINTWDISRLFEEAMKYYQLSIRDEKILQETPLGDFEEILRNYTKTDLILPTLYDFLVYRVISAYSGEMNVMLPQQTFVLNKPEYFADVNTFTEYSIEKTDTLSAEYQVIRLYQKLLKFRLNQANVNGTNSNDEYALVNLDIERFKYLRENGWYADNNELYRAAIQLLMDNYAGKKQWVYPAYQMALFYKQLGDGWRVNKDGNRLKYKQAYALCKKILNTYPDSQLTSYVKGLQKEIESPAANFVIHNEQYPDTPILALLNYKNIVKLDLIIYKLTDKEFDLYKDRYNYNNNSVIKDKTPVSTQTITVPSQNDYQNYSAEVMIDPLPQGNYIIMATNDSAITFKDKNNEKLSAYFPLQVTPLKMVVRIGDSKLFGLSTAKYDNIIQTYVTDSKTGKPVKNAKIDYYTQRWQSGKRGESGKYVEILEGSYHSDDDGIAYVKRNNNNNSFKKAVVTYNGSKLTSYDWYTGYWGRNNQVKHNKVLFFTDRAIYRPGQTVYYKALYIKTDEQGNNSLITKSNLSVQLRDVNFKTVASQNHTTNDYGTIQGSFTIPQGLLNGTMTLYTSNGSVSIKVEEYKRPTFEVKFDPVKNNYGLNSQVEVSGLATALAGYAVDNSKVQYRVIRQAEYRFYRWWYPPVSQPQREIASGEITTDSKGAFVINFKAEADDIKNDNLIYNYLVTADITDVNGETRSATQTVRISKKPLLISTNIPSRISGNDKLIFDLTTTNLNGDITPADVTVKITALKAPDKILRSRLWAAPDTFALSKAEFDRYFPYDAYGDENNPENYPEIKQLAVYNLKTDKLGNLQGNEQLNKINLTALTTAPSGWYKINIKAKNAEGIEVEEARYVNVSLSPSPINNMEEWITVIKNSGEPGENVEFWLAGGNSQSYVRYEILYNDEIVKHEKLTVGITPQRITIPIKEEYRGGFAVQFIMIQNDRFYSSLNEISVPYTNKQLDVKFITFRDKLLPGEKEKWAISVKNKNGDKEMAEMVATLYDASLDVFVPHSWNATGALYPTRNHYKYNWRLPSYSTITNSQYENYNEYRANIYQIKYPYLYLFGNNYTNLFYTGRVRQSSAAIYGSRSSSLTMVDQEMALDEVVVVGYGSSRKESVIGSVQQDEADSLNDAYAPSVSGGGGEAKEPPLTEIATRQNFNETAFFYPQLKTNEDGEIIIEFTIPEALTRWKMLGFAHTKDLKTGTVSNELITQKEVAISANAPRFFRENDRIDFTAKVNNITEGELNGQALLRVYDATNMQPLDDKILISAQTQNFSVKGGESAGLKWTLVIPEGIQAITYRVTAQAGNHTDGEEKVVPVLANTMLVTETMPFSIRAGQEKTFTFNRLKDNQSTTLRNHKLTLEFTSNPAWYAVQSIPYLMEYPYECAEQVFARFYANSLATTIVNSSPRVKQVFDLWRNIPENKNALLSNLEKNQELKQVLLEETPWVMQAENETERKKRVGLLFDLNRMSGELQIAFDKLQKKQSSNGGFPWFEGLPENRYITQHIVSGMAHLNKLNALTDNFKNNAAAMVQNGLSYLDYSIKKDYDDLLKNKNVDLEKQHISPIQVHYLYTCSFDGHKPQNAEQLKAFEYYYGQAVKYWMNFNIYNQSMIALAMNRYGNSSLAQAIIKSLKERSQQSEEMGMYWKDNVAGYFWYQAPIETQAMLIEAFDEITNDKLAVEEMKIWLLRNKQTNDWRTTKATTEACYALLMTGSNLLDESKVIEVKIAGKPLAEIAKEDIRPEPGTGYVKTSWDGSDINKDMATLEVKNPNNSGIAWGGVYWQYFEQLDKITGAETNIKINKQLFLKNITQRGAELLPLNGQNVLKVGDVVTVRMELRADRDYEFIHLKDMRAAGFEPVKTLSGYRYQDGLWYYESIKDASTNFFINIMRKGTYVFEYELRVTHSGEFSNGITTFQCMYAPEFSAHSEGVRVKVE